MQMLHDLGWCELKDRRRDLRLALLYNIVTGNMAINSYQIGLVAADNRTRVQSKLSAPIFFLTSLHSANSKCQTSWR